MCGYVTESVILQQLNLALGLKKLFSARLMS